MVRICGVYVFRLYLRKPLRRAWRALTCAPQSAATAMVRICGVYLFRLHVKKPLRRAWRSLLAHLRAVF
jgi:hypothetical protein